LVVKNKILLIASILTISRVFSYGQSSDLGAVCAESQQVYGVDGFDDSEFIWSFDSRYGTVVNGNGTDTITIDWGYSTGTVDLEVLEITIMGCFNVPSRGTVEIIAPDVDLGDDFPEMCDEDSMVFDAGDYHDEPFSILWQDGSTETQYTATTTEQIWVRVIDGHGCVRYDTVSLLVHPLPAVSVGGDTILCDPGSTYMIRPIDPNDPSNDFYSYTWTTSGTGWGREDHNSEYLVYPNSSDIPDTIVLDVKDFNECPATDTMLLYPCNYEALFRDMPNTITPNGDGVNDVWNIPYMTFFDEAVLEIFDRWGRLVFRTTNVFEDPWDGRSKGKDLPMDAYYFVLDLHKSGSKPIVGTINLVR